MVLNLLLWLNCFALFSSFLLPPGSCSGFCHHDYKNSRFEVEDEGMESVANISFTVPLFSYLYSAE